MKPLPTLTKPLRSVDIETKEPAQALRERTDSCTVPAAGVVGEAMVALELADGVPREVRRRPHGRRAGRARRLQASASGGSAGRTTEAAPTGVRSCSSASWAPASRPPCACSRPSSAASRRRRPRARARAWRADRRRSSTARASRRSASARRRSCCGCSPTPTSAWSRSAAARRSERVREALGRHLVVHLEVDARGRLAARLGAGARWPATAAASSSSTASAAPCTSRSPTPRCRRPTATCRGGRSTRSSAALAPAGHAPGLGLGGVRRRTRCSSATAWWRRASSTRRRAARFVVTDPNVAAHHSLQGEATVEIPPGEPAKTLARAEQVLRELARAGATRGDLVVAVGGGVVGDLAGFCAAVYQRGMRHVQVPTTLVAQVDSAFGGKTGVDLPEGKNYAGAYHQPSAVIVDPDVLATLPPEEAAAGYAEVVKTALIAGGPLWARVRAGGDPDDGRRSRLPARRSCGRRRGRARRRPPPGAEPGPHGGARDRGRHRLLPLPARRGGRPRPARLPAAVGPRDAARRGGRAARRPRAARPLRGRERGRGGGAGRARQEARGGAGAVRLVEAPGEVTPGHDVDEPALRAALEELAA